MSSSLRRYPNESIATHRIRSTPNGELVATLSGNTAIFENITISGEITGGNKKGSFYKTSEQLLPSGTNLITWDLSETWSNDGYIELQNDLSSFIVKKGSVYDLRITGR